MNHIVRQLDDALSGEARDEMVPPESFGARKRFDLQCCQVRLMEGSIAVAGISSMFLRVSSIAEKGGRWHVDRGNGISLSLCSISQSITANRHSNI
jgi:hypothetical protein